jgi:hypothetical protein
LGDTFPYVVVALVVFGVLFGLLFIRTALARSSWSIADALSEETTTTALDASGKPLLDASNKPIETTVLKASSSRMIALAGLIVILMMYVGLGCVVLRDYAALGQVRQEVTQPIYFLISGATLFAPYVVNKFASIFSSLLPKN